MYMTYILMELSTKFYSVRHPKAPTNGIEKVAN